MIAAGGGAMHYDKVDRTDAIQAQPGHTVGGYGLGGNNRLLHGGGWGWSKGRAESLNYHVFLQRGQNAGGQMVVRFVQDVQQFGIVLYPRFQPDAGTGGGNVGEIEGGKFFEPVRTVLKLRDGITMSGGEVAA